MKVYLSHSYRDAVVNGYFLEHFLDDEVTLLADQKTDVWCVAKLERYLSELDGFVSIVTQRSSEVDAHGFSPYIGQELELARRAKIPRLLFVDDRVLQRHRLLFPSDAVAFVADQPDDYSRIHADAINRFQQHLEVAPPRRRGSVPKGACIVVGDGKSLRSIAEDLAEVLRRQDFSIEMLAGRRPGRGLEDIRLLESLRAAELCVFLLGERLSDAHIGLAMAHAECIPSVRLQYTPSDIAPVEPTVSGLVRWTSADDLLVEFARQVASYQEGLVLPVERALVTTATDAARSIGTMKWSPRDDNLWDVSDGQSLLQHLHPDHRFIRDEVARAHGTFGRALGTARGREAGHEVCAILYEGLRRHGFAYEIEPVTLVAGHQAIRTPSQIEAHRTATCVDVAMLFADLLLAAGQHPLIAVVDGPDFAHALAGYRAPGEPTWEQRGMADLRGALARGDAVLFEATGAIESDKPVAAEDAASRRDKTFGFADAGIAAQALLARSDVVLRHFVDVSDKMTAA